MKAKVRRNKYVISYVNPFSGQYIANDTVNLQFLNWLEGLTEVQIIRVF
jgi:hypothetical protein